MVRIGKLAEHQVKINKGSEFRLFQKKKKLKGTDRYCFCDLGDWFESLQVGDKLLVGFGNYIWSVKGKETLSEGMNSCKIEDKSESKYDRSEVYSCLSSTFSMISRQTTNERPRILDQKHGGLETIKETPQGLDGSTMMDPPEIPVKRTRFTAEQRKKMFEYHYDNEVEKENNNYQVLVVEVLNDCVINSHSPVFFDLIEEEGRMIPNKIQNINSSISRKDINFIDKALKYNFDFIGVNDVTSKDTLKEVRMLCRKKPSTKIIAKIQSPVSIKNIAGIIDMADGIIISRNY